MNLVVKLKTLLILTFMSMTFLVNAQEIYKITGKVTHETVALERINVKLIDSSYTTTTNENGLFTIISRSHKPMKLIISGVGFKTLVKNIDWKGKSNVYLDIEIDDATSELKEIEITTFKTNNTVKASIDKSGIKSIDLPQAITVISSQLINDQQAMKLSDVIRNVNGVYLSSSRASTQETFGARGYRFSADNLYKNGARINSGIYPEMSSLESVEVLKGSAAIMYGNVAPGGIVNMVTKQPKFEFGGEVNFRTGSFDVYRPSFDVYGPISNKVAYRLNAVYDNEGSYRRSVKLKKYYFNPSFLFQINDKTSIVLEGDYLNTHSTPDFGIGSLNNTKIAPLGSSVFLGNNWQYVQQNQATTTATLKHQFNDDWKLTAMVSYQYYLKDYFSIERIQAAQNGDWERPLNRINSNENFANSQVNLIGKAKTGALAHQMIFGADANYYSIFNNVFDNNWGYSVNGVSKKGIYDKINILNFNPAIQRNDIPTATILRTTRTNSASYGLFAQDLISIGEKLKVLTALRWSVLQDLGATTNTLKDQSVVKGAVRPVQGVLSPKIGLVYKFIPTSSVFASYTNSFLPNTSGTDVHGNTLKPSIVDQYELGFKNDFFNNKISANVTLYSIINHNLVQMAQFQKDGLTPNTNTNLKELAGQTKSDGLEIDLSGSPLKGLNIMTGYSYNFARYTKSTNYISGERLVNTPLHTFNASTFYTFSDTRLNGLKLGISVFYTGSRYGGWNNTKQQSQDFNRLIFVKGFTTLDISAGYAIRRISILAKLGNVGNVFNYYVHENYSINPIMPRNFMATISYQF